MHSGHVVGYVAGVAIALGVGGALWLSTPTAAADTGTSSTHSSSSGMAKSARAPQRALPPRKVVVASDVKRTTGQAVRPAAAYTPPSSISADGTRQFAIGGFTDSQNQAMLTLTVTDTATGDPVGPPLTVAGDGVYVATAQFLTANGSRVLLTTAVYNFDQVNGNFTTWARVVDTATGTVIGNPVVVRGYPAGTPLTSASGSRAAISTFVDSLTSGNTSTRTVVIDTVTGRRIGTTVVLPGHPVSTRSLIPGSGVLLTRTDLGIGARVDTNSGAALTIPIAFPWGLDLAPLAPAVFVADLFLGVFVVLPAAAVIGAVEKTLHSLTPW